MVVVGIIAVVGIVVVVGNVGLVGIVVVVGIIAVVGIVVGICIIIIVVVAVDHDNLLQQKIHPHIPTTSIPPSPHRSATIPSYPSPHHTDTQGRQGTSAAQAKHPTPELHTFLMDDISLFDVNMDLFQYLELYIGEREFEFVWLLWFQSTSP